MYEGHMLNWEELAPVARWIPLLSFQHRFYSVVAPLWPPSCQSPRGSLTGRVQRNIVATDAQTQHYHHSRIHSPLAHAATNPYWSEFRSWWQLVFHNSFPFFVDFCQNQIFALHCFNLSTLYRGSDCCVTAAAPQSRKETSPPSVSSKGLSNSSLLVCHTSAAASM